MAFNRVILQGRLTRDPEMRVVGTSKVVKWSVAVSQKYKTKTGEDKETTVFVDCETWGLQVDNVLRLLKKGSPVLLEGRLKSEEWKDATTGAKRSKLLVTTDTIDFLQPEKPSGEITGFNFDEVLF